ncbi:unnamed protein product [Notodromas monacha]|uniref:Uncharacterized protein n=1 Tax=Notodromas monacha TaxID=399045 RepID=A0A7R9C0H6_9CRUS|nr:unnamed protein product [Notodromas monacha]CAG0923737.1 unnamed protein product [Notodromas monacha]
MNRWIGEIDDVVIWSDCEIDNGVYGLVFWIVVSMVRSAGVGCDLDIRSMCWCRRGHFVGDIAFLSRHWSNARLGVGRT